MVRLGVIGCGYWGSKHVRNLSEIPQTELGMVADLDEGKLDKVRAAYPAVATTQDYKELFEAALEGVVIATPPTTHYRLAREALLAGKHVLVEKPLTVSSEEALELVRLAESRNLVLMVGHTYTYHPAVNCLRQLVESGELGDVYYIDSARLNLGLFQPDVNVLWDLAPHDLSIILELLGKQPVSVSARGAAHINPRIYDVAYLELRFPGDVLAHVHLSWLDPCKVRRLTIVGSKKMVVYNDVADGERVRVYDKGVSLSSARNDFEYWPLGYRNGDVVIPHIPDAEPLKLECTHFAQCIARGERARSDGWAGLQVVSILETAERSLRNGGLREKVAPLAGLQVVQSIPQGV